MIVVCVQGARVIDDSGRLKRDDCERRAQLLLRSKGGLPAILLAARAVMVAFDRVPWMADGDANLHLAAMASGHNGAGILEVLLEAIPPTHRSKCVSAKCKNFGNTALHWATLNGATDSCELLLAHGASLTKKNRQKETPLDYAIKYEHQLLRVRYESLRGADAG